MTQPNKKLGIFQTQLVDLLGIPGQLFKTFKAAQHFNPSQERLLAIATLPSMTQVHIAGFGREAKSNSVRARLLRQNNMKLVRLEGNFEFYFKLYAQEAEGVALRQVLDPGTMAFLADFCKEYDWELIDCQLYLVQQGFKSERTDNSLLIDDLGMFIKRLGPVLNRFQKEYTTKN